jgi:hypothetical protein
LKMEAVCSSETSVATQQTTRRYIPEDDTLQKSKLFSFSSTFSLSLTEVFDRKYQESK